LYFYIFLLLIVELSVFVVRLQRPGPAMPPTAEPFASTPLTAEHASTQAPTPHSHHPPGHRCLCAKTSFCAAVLKSGIAAGDEPASRQTFRSQRTLYTAGQKLDGVPVIREGWAARHVQLADGRRQILAILLPGDTLTPAVLFRDALDFSVQALTQVRIERYDRALLRARVARDPKLADTVAHLFAAECALADRSLTDLGQRPADERMARFILHLLQRLQARGMVKDLTFDCPLRQRQIADAMGLTPVHVNRVLGQFRRSGIMTLADGVLSIFRLADLRAIANLR
jgi:CRP/FNR family transcriptional regulator, anaerobic regulatory protein